MVYRWPQVLQAKWHSFLCGAFLSVYLSQFNGLLYVQRGYSNDCNLFGMYVRVQCFWSHFPVIGFIMLLRFYTMDYIMQQHQTPCCSIIQPLLCPFPLIVCDKQNYVVIYERTHVILCWMNVAVVVDEIWCQMSQCDPLTCSVWRESCFLVSVAIHVNLQSLTSVQ